MRFLYISLIGLLLLGCVPIPEPITETPTTTPSQTSAPETPTPTGSGPPTTVSPVTPTSTDTPTGTPLPGDDPVLVGAGDIAHCSRDGDEATAKLLDDIPGTVFTTGDNVYPDGTATDFRDCYDPSWGRHKARTYPSAGNHDYHVEGAAYYFDYFGTRAGEPDKGYYSYDLGTWHIIVLNSNIPVEAGSPQEQWLRVDLATHPVACTLAYWHHARFSSGSRHGSNTKMQPLWQALYDYGADVILAGHEHNYERFALQDPRGVADPIRGIRQFVIGSGGRNHYKFGSPIANSEVRISDSYGVLKLVLHPDSYSWEFIPVTGKPFTDSGSAPCVTPETPVSSGVFVFGPTDDATVKLESPEANYGSKKTLQADNSPGRDNFLVKFVVSGVNGRSVQNAKLRLYNVNGSDTGGDIYHVVDSAWTENTVIWNTAPMNGVYLSSLGPVRQDMWYEVDITPVITGDGIYSFRVSTSSRNGADYASKEGKVGLAPQLIVSVGETGSP